MTSLVKICLGEFGLKNRSKVSGPHPVPSLPTLLTQPTHPAQNNSFSDTFSPESPDSPDFSSTFLNFPQLNTDFNTEFAQFSEV